MDAQDYYHHFAKQHFLAHQDESETRSEELIQRGYENFQWVLSKYDVSYDNNESKNDHKDHVEEQGNTQE